MNESPDGAKRLWLANPARTDSFDSARVAPIVDRIIATKSTRHMTAVHSLQAKVYAGAAAVATAAAIAFSLSATSGPVPSLAIKIPHSLTLNRASTAHLYPPQSGRNSTGRGVHFGTFVLTYQFQIGANFSGVAPIH